MKNEKGLTFISTAILVVIIALFVFALIYFARIQIIRENAENIKTDMLLVQAKVNSISEKSIIEKNNDILTGTKLSDMKDDPKIKEFLDKGLFDADKKDKSYYVLNQQDLNDLELGNVILEEGNYYIVEYSSRDVYYTKGYTNEYGQIYYKSSEIENMHKAQD